MYYTPLQVFFFCVFVETKRMENRERKNEYLSFYLYYKTLIYHCHHRDILPVPNSLSLPEILYVQLCQRDYSAQVWRKNLFLLFLVDMRNPISAFGKERGRFEVMIYFSQVFFISKNILFINTSVWCHLYQILCLGVVILKQ